MTGISWSTQFAGTSFSRATLIEFRLAREGDMENYLVTTGHGPNHASRATWNRFMAQADDLIGSAVVAVVDDRIIGIGAVGIMPNGEKHAWIAPSKELRRHSVSVVRALKAAVRGVMESLDGEPLYIGIGRKRKSTRKLAAYLGFREVREEGNDIISVLEN